MNAGDTICAERFLPHKSSCMIMNGDVVCSCGAKREREILETVAKADGGLVGLDYSRETFFIVKKLERAGKLNYCGRDTGRIMVCRITIKGV